MDELAFTKLDAAKVLRATSFVGPWITGEIARRWQKAREDVQAEREQLRKWFPWLKSLTLAQADDVLHNRWFDTYTLNDDRIRLGELARLASRGNGEVWLQSDDLYLLFEKYRIEVPALDSE